ncbi:CHAT domain-containing protein [Streptomyces sp. NPDC049040]|uniref:CHAT domain-containing protein n=1 Tax=Streptomyces sp. NPDC049040 TaxID=3365593 RepID=UPI00371A168A
MGLFGGGGGRMQPAAFQEQVLQLRARCEQSGPTAAVVDESWRQMRYCFDELARGNDAFAGLLFDTARTSFTLHARTGQWFFAVASGIAFGTAVAAIDAGWAARGRPFPDELRPGVQSMVDMCVAMAHRAGVPLAGCVLAESLTTLRLGDRTHAREMSDLLAGAGARRKLRTVRDLQRRQIARARQVTPGAADTVAALQAQVDGMLLADLEAALADGSGRYVLAGSTVAPAALAAATTGRCVLVVAPGVEEGAAFRLDPATGNVPDHGLCRSVALPRLTLAAVKEQAGRVREVLGPGERRKRVRDAAVRDALTELSAAVWEPVLTAWPELRGGRVAVVPLGEAALLPLFTAPVDGIPAGAAMDLTIVPSGRALLFASAWPRPSHREVLVAADPWFADDAGGTAIPFTVDEARSVAAVHGVEPLILREAVGGGNGGSAGAGGTGAGRGTAEGPAGADDRLRTFDVPARTGPQPARTGPQPAPDSLTGRISVASLLHLAGHGQLDPRDPLRSEMLLGQALPLSSLLERDLRRGATVVLSACHLGGIGTEQSSEQLGFPAAMLAMGAGSVAAALWPVPDSQETVRLMTRFHQELRAPGVPPSVALGRAVSWAAAEGLRPTTWAPFTHFGA